jgi:hypothetical protein
MLLFDCSCCVQVACRTVTLRIQLVIATTMRHLASGAAAREWHNRVPELLPLLADY